MERTISDSAKHLLCRAYLSRPRWATEGLYLIDRSLLGKDMKQLEAAGLVQEWFTPWSDPCYLTDDGVDQRKQWRSDLGYND